MFINITRVRSKRASLLAASENTIVKLVLDSIIYYPTCMILWLPHIIAVIMEPFFENNVAFDMFFNISVVVKIFHGLATAAIFVFKSRDARQFWWELLTCKSDHEQDYLDLVVFEDTSVKDSEAIEDIMTTIV
jgi:hypothetical protein